MKKLRNDLKGLMDLLKEKAPPPKKTVQELFDEAISDPIEIEFELGPLAVHDPLGLLKPEPSEAEKQANMDFWKDNSK